MVNPESYTYVVMAELKPTIFDNCTFCKKEIQTNDTFTHTLRCAEIVEIVVAALRCASDSAAIAQR